MSRIMRDLSEAKALTDSIRAERGCTRRLGRITETTYGARVVSREFCGKPAFWVEAYTVTFDPHFDMHLPESEHIKKAMEWEAAGESTFSSPHRDAVRFLVVYYPP